MKVIKEGISNLEKAIDGGACINPVMAAAEVESEKYKERTEKITKEVDKVKPNIEKGFTGATKQPVPKEPELPKFELDEDIFEDPSPMNESLEKSLKEGFNINSDNVWDRVEETKEILGEEEFLDTLLKAMDTDAIIDYLQFIWRMYDIGDVEDVEESFETPFTKDLKCKKILNDYIDWNEVDKKDVDTAIEQLRSLQSSGEITADEYNYIIHHWDELLDNKVDESLNEEPVEDKE